MTRLTSIVNEAARASKSRRRADTPEISMRRTPLGEPMSEEEAREQDKHPLEWHLRYWHDLGVVGALYSPEVKEMINTVSTEQHKIFDADAEMQYRTSWLQYISTEYAHNFALAVSLEQSKIRDPDFRAELCDASIQYENDHRLDTVEHWAQVPEQSENVQRYLRDLERMPVENPWRHYGNYIKAMEMTSACAIKQKEYLRHVDDCWNEYGHFWSDSQTESSSNS